MLTIAIWWFAYPDVGQPPFSVVSVEYACALPPPLQHVDQPSQKENISPGIPSFTSQTSIV